ncbi:hypothetical protein ACLBW2_03520 [Enterobacteriaceae bacterium C23F]
MNDTTNDKNDFRTRRIKLEGIKQYIPESIFNSLLEFLNSRNYSMFDNMFQAYAPPHLRDVYQFESSDSEISALRIKDLEMKVAESRAISKSLHEKIEKLEIDLGSALGSKQRISDQLKTQANKNRELTEQNQELLSKIQQKKIDEKVPEYVQGVKEKLQQDDKDFTAMSYNWAIAGIIFALLAIISAFLTFFFKIDIKGTTLTELLYYYTRGLLGVALLSWLSYFCLNNSKKYTHEAIIRKDRQHALMFGEVFLQIYGSTATKQDAIDVFKDWNMSANSAFSDKTQQPPSLFNILGSVLDKKTAANDDKLTSKPSV